ncbi:MAG: hypothetical protein Q7I92_08865, partial [Humidesulfovibrio sp.]|nr:hypothetical protein [Humidesulfovibrio sp.]
FEEPKHLREDFFAPGESVLERKQLDPCQSPTGSAHVSPFPADAQCSSALSMFVHIPSLPASRKCQDSNIHLHVASIGQDR